jgi:hypothetical protein
MGKRFSTRQTLDSGALVPFQISSECEGIVARIACNLSDAVLRIIAIAVVEKSDRVVLEVKTVAVVPLA